LLALPNVALKGKTMLKKRTKSLKYGHYVMLELSNIQGVEKDWQLKVLQETDNL
jgi:hypothetical protein